MSTTYDLTDPEARADGIARATEALGARGLVVMPTDTVYGVAADAFSPQAVATLLAAKGRGRHMPPPVLIPRPETLQGLATDIPEGASAVAEKFWPGALTLILMAQPSLTWDLGETRGTVALRMPDHKDALELLSQTGPLAVSSANRSGMPAAMSAQKAHEMLGDSVAVYLEGAATKEDAAFNEDEPAESELSESAPSESEPAPPSTIVDYTVTPPKVVRAGALSVEQLREADPSILDIDGNPAPNTEPATNTVAEETPEP
ncbi:L-threonylcarbamoyladenylate synthase [Pseudoglutamicibacter albus]|uniref:L-threonylcarbamoyladenylate synthase n=1 Tax=Pseudoglutamicibacter albus TaxID=98671 RepID=A0ABU1YZD8_9MICC|nr:L-threonylcarbamoyladenylate synthase [Pseudoglutamicibacter albus]MDR7293734.1 tRNA threonylcarbamoyl adenosine modification protein (Sua5/YciO/YrdC/YwlC family) [Pseudoglutamicibacter albus]